MIHRTPGDFTTSTNETPTPITYDDIVRVHKLMKPNRIPTEVRVDLHLLNRLITFLTHNVAFEDGRFARLLEIKCDGEFATLVWGPVHPAYDLYRWSDGEKLNPRPGTEGGGEVMAHVRTAIPEPGDPVHCLNRGCNWSGPFRDVFGSPNTIATCPQCGHVVARGNRPPAGPITAARVGLLLFIGQYKYPDKVLTDADDLDFLEDLGLVEHVHGDKWQTTSKGDALIERLVAVANEGGATS